MCKSTDPWMRVVRNLPNECRVFSTKERCPVLMSFEMRKEPDGSDVAEYLHSKFEYGVGGERSESFDSADPDDDAASAGGDSVHSLPSSLPPPPATNPAPAAAAAANPPPSTNGAKNPKKSLFQQMVSSSPFSQKLSATMAFKTRTENYPNSPRASKKHNLWKDASAAEAAGNSEGGGSDTPHKRDKREKNWRVAKMLKEMPQVKMPKALSALKRDKSSTNSQPSKIDYKKVKIYKSVSDAGLDQTEISPEGINGAKMFICGGEIWAEKSARLKAASGVDDPDLVINAVIAKSNDDVRQEVFIMQMIHFYQSVFKEEGLPLFLKPYKILATSKETGLIELLKDSTSIDGLKKSDGYPGNMRAYFEQAYGGKDSDDFKRAQNNFMHSLAGYSIVAYLLGLKDRHNGNVMINTKGQLVHIDFGFAFGMAPGHEFSMERAPFKLTKEYVDVLGGPKSPKYEEFKNLFLSGFRAARESSQIAIGLISIMMYRSNYPCFSGFRYGGNVAIDRFKKRLMLDVPDDRIDARARALVDSSYNHKGTVWYDDFQLMTNGIAP
jgi:phosphatidylinositol 4-kinase